jgi:hypothetical protein
MPIKGFIIGVHIDWCLWLLNRAGSLLCHTCCDNRPRLLWSHPKDCPIYDQHGVLRSYSNPDPHKDIIKITSERVSSMCIALQ